MKPLHYLIFHPDKERTKTEVKGKAFIESQVTDWQGYVWVDKPDGSNEDPFVFSETWLYSYCHATQLRREESSKYAYVRAGSYLFFCSGDAADKGTIQLDTVFIVDHVAKWMDNPQRLPEEFQKHYQNKNSDLWLRHFMHPFHGCHNGEYTYVSRQWFDSKDEYSFLPISQNGDRVEFDLKLLTPDLKSKIEHKRDGKYPIILSEEEKTELLRIILSLTSIQVIQNLTRLHNDIKIIDSCSTRCGAKSVRIAKC